MTPSEMLCQHPAAAMATAGSDVVAMVTAGSRYHWSAMENGEVEYATITGGLSVWLHRSLAVGY